MEGISEIANGSADHSLTSTNYNTNALWIPKSHDQSKKSHDTIPTVKLGEDAYSSNAGVLLRKQIVAPDITHKASEDKDKVSDPRSLKDETELEKSVQCTQAQPVYENVYIGKQIPIVKSGSSVGATMNADVTSEPLHEISNKAIESNPDMKLTNSTVDSSQKLHTVEEDMVQDKQKIQRNRKISKLGKDVYKIVCLSVKNLNLKNNRQKQKIHRLRERVFIMLL